MVSTFIEAFKIKNAYRTNTFIYSIKQFPILKKLLKDTLYSNKILKVLGTIVSIIMELMSIFLGKFLYVWLVIFSLLPLYSVSKVDLFLHFFFFLTLAGAFMNTYMFNPTKDKYYAMFTMRLDARMYTLSDFYYRMITVFVGFIPFILFFGHLIHLPLWIAFIIPVFIVSAKMLANIYFLKKYEKYGIITDENHPAKGIWIFVGICLLFTYGLPYINIVLPWWLTLICMSLFILISIFGISYLHYFKYYREVYKRILTEGNMNMASYKTNTVDVQREQMMKQMDIHTDITSTKHGYAYFNDLFVKRHSKLLLRSAKKTALISLVIIIIVSLALWVNPPLAKMLNRALLIALPYFVFVMYIINRGQVVSQAMFMNCDHSMLTYGFYREPKVILNLFRERLKSVIVINLLPALVIATGLVFLLYMSGGTTEWLEYPLLFFSIIAMSIFFSVHHLVMYYLLQPYNVHSELKSSTYTVVNAITYFACYYMLQIKMPIFIFGLMTIIFSILYCFISLILVYRFAPKTFKLRI